MRPIKEGDRVLIIYNNGLEVERNVYATVLNTPQDVGDLWYFKNDADLVFAQNPVSPNLDTIILLENEDG